MKSLKTITLTALAVVSFTAVAHAQSPQKVRFATEGAFAPANYTLPDGTLAGFEIDLYRDLCKRASLDCTIEAQAFEGLIPGLNAGKFDAIMASINATPKREEVILFTTPYYNTGQTFATSKGNALTNLPEKGVIFSLNSDEAGTLAELEKLKPLLKGKTVGVQVNTINGAFIEKYLKGVMDLREYKTTEQHDLDLASGRLDLVMASTGYLATVAKEKGNENMAITGPRFAGGLLGKGSAIGLRKSDTELKAKLDKAIAEANADGTIKRLGDKYYGFDVSIK